MNNLQQNTDTAETRVSPTKAADPVYFNDGELDRDFADLVSRFDARRIEGKRAMISMFDVLETRMRKEQGEVLTDDVREVVGDMKRFFEQRLDSSKKTATAAENKRKTVSENQSAARLSVAVWLSEQVNSENAAVRSLTGDLLTELEPENVAIQNTPEFIEMILTERAKEAKETGEPTEQGERIAGTLSKLACNKNFSSDEISEDLTTVVDQILNPNGGE